VRYVEAVRDYADAPRPWVFLAGGITDCPDWQQEIRVALGGGDLPGTLLNPRRADFPIHDPNAAVEQITWEFHALNAADVFSMWFSAGPSVQPICMYELGRHLARWEHDFAKCRRPGMRVCVGIEPGYLRAQDVLIQTKLVVEQDTPEIAIAASLAEHAENIAAAVRFLGSVS
jgi:hypothetical protein